jgi:hypothetical protein
VALYFFANMELEYILVSFFWEGNYHIRFSGD